MRRRQTRLITAGALLILCASAAPTEATAQQPSPLSVVKSLGLERQRAGRATVYYRPEDRSRARQLAELVDSATTIFERDFDLVLPVELAVLRPEDWFSQYPGVPYAVPWPSINEHLLLLPSSLEEGVLVEGRPPLIARRTVDFVTLHELGHIAAKEYFRPDASLEYIPVSWFDELLATYFAYSYVASVDPAWAADARQEWAATVEGFEPRTLSLDWSFMDELNGAELARTYGWYQTILNLRTAELFDVHGIGLPRTLESMPWDEVEDWTTESVLESLETIAPDFVHWARGFGADS